MTKHSKYKNTGILYEMILHVLTNNIINNTDTSPVLKIIRENFQQDTEISKELQLYKRLLESKYQDIDMAKKLVSETVNKYKQLDHKKLRIEKYNLIKYLKESFDLDELLQIRINEYKQLASIYNLFTNSKNSKIDSSRLSKSRKTLVEHIINKPVESKTQFDRIPEFVKLDEESRILTYKLLTEKFNKKYSKLSKPQKEILSTYVNNISDNINLKEYVNEHIPRIRKKLMSLKECVNFNEVQKLKLDEITNNIDTFLSGNIINENHIFSLLNYYEIIRVLEHNKR